MRPVLFFDMESYSEIDIRKAGAAAYVRHGSTEPIMITWCIDSGPVHYADLTLTAMPQDLVGMLMSPQYLKCAANIPFDKGLLEHRMGITFPWEDCVDSHTLAYSLGFSGGLDAIGEQVGLPSDKAKLKSGKKLILRFCKPQPKNHKTRRWTRENDIEKWMLFADYAIQDTEAMRTLWYKIIGYNSMSEFEWNAWRISQRMNEAGVPIDRGLVNTAIALVGERKEQIKDQLKGMTGLPNPCSVAQFKPWLEANGVDLPNLQAATVDNALEHMASGATKDALQLFRTVRQIAPAKWDAILGMMCDDDTVKGMFTFMGASRTGRYASRGINLQNLRRPPAGMMDDLIQYVYRGDNSLINLIFGEPLDFLSRTVRGAITAPPGKKLDVSDLSSIESRIVGWLANCRRMMDIFAQDKDTYIDFATELFNIKYDEVTKAQRTFSKPPVLGCSYMMGAVGLQAYAEGMGIEMTDKESKHAVDVFRGSYPEIRDLWGWLMNSISYVLMTGQPARGYYLTISLEGEFMFITLPSGRRVGYFQPRWELWDTPIGNKMSFTYKGINRFKSAPTWERIGAHAGGVTENIIQAIARDVLIEWMVRADRIKDIELVGTVHDEFIYTADDSIADERLEELNQMIAEPIDWAPGLLLAAEGFVGKHYDK